MSIEVWKKWTDQNGLVSDRTPGRITHNGLMFTAPYVWWLKKTMPQGNSDYQAELNRVEAIYESCWVPNGGFKRAPSGWTEWALQQADDMYAVAWVSVMLTRRDWAARLLEVARQNYGVLNPTNPGQFKWKAWLTRHPNLYVTLQVAAGERPSLYGLLTWCAVLLFSMTRMRHRDSRVKAFMAVQVMKTLELPEGQPAFRVLHYVIQYWESMVFRRYVGYGHMEYFKSEHPVKRFMGGWI